MLGFYLVSGWVAIALVGFWIWVRDRQAYRRQKLIEQRIRPTFVSEDEALDELDLPYWRRVVVPRWQRTTRILAQKVTPQGFRGELKRQLQTAGIKLSPEEYFLYRLGAALVGVAAGVVLAALNPLWASTLRLAAPLGLGAILYLLIGAHVNTLAQRRLKEIERSLPDVFDLLSVSVEAGLAFDGALRRVTVNIEGPIREELLKVLADMQIGLPRAAALAALAERTRSQHIKRFSALVAQSDRTGSGIGAALRTQAREIKAYRAARAREQAASIPVKILFPMVIFIFPAIFIVILGPAVLSVLTLLH
jgi:tight adherence protein C